MVGCSAPNCSNVSAAGYRLFRFPSEHSRRAIWLKNCRRDRWEPTSTSRLCEVHFEDNQWEHKRADGWKKLKPNAIPTLFNVPNPATRLLSARKFQCKMEANMMDEAVSIKVEPNWDQEPEDTWPEDQNGCEIGNFAFAKCEVKFEEEDVDKIISNVKEEVDENHEEYSNSAAPSLDFQVLSSTLLPAKPVGTQSKDSITHNTEDVAEKNFPCPECGKLFARRSYLLKHTKLLHVERNRPKCPKCGSSFSTQEGLRYHIRTHTGENPFVCMRCSRAFARKSYLKRHMFIHRGEDSETDAQIVAYSCTDCGKSFYSNSVLMEHMFTHKGEKPFSCTLCSSSFAMKSYLRQHMIVHTRARAYYCDTCGSSFIWKSHLQRHMLKHFEEQQNTQEVCKISDT